MNIYFKTLMKLFKALKKFINYLRKKEILKNNYYPVQEKETVSEKIIENHSISHVRNWATDKIESLYESDHHQNAKAIEKEFDEWINLSKNAEDLEYFCLENREWTDEQEIDVL